MRKRYTEEQWSRALGTLASNPDVAVAKLRFDADCPSYHLLTARARRDAGFKGRLAESSRSRRKPGHSPYSDTHFAEAIALIAELRLARYLELATARGLPNFPVLKRRRATDPAFDQAYRSAVKTGRRDMLSWKPKPQLPGGQLVASLRDCPIFVRANKAVPKTYYEREDVVTDIIEAVLSGEIGEDEIEKRAAFYCTRHNNQFSSNAFASLDRTMMIGGEEIMLADNLSTTEWSFEGSI